MVPVACCVLGQATVFKCRPFIKRVVIYDTGNHWGPFSHYAVILILQYPFQKSFFGEEET